MLSSFVAVLIRFEAFFCFNIFFIQEIASVAEAKLTCCNKLQYVKNPMRFLFSPLNLGKILAIFSSLGNSMVAIILLIQFIKWAQVTD